MNSATVFAAIAATLYAAHQLADHVLGQTDHQAANKAAPGWTGWRHNAYHVGLYHLVMTAMLLTAVAVLDLPLTATGLAAGIGFSAVTHAILDRRWPVRWLLEHTRSKPFARMASHGINGMYLADQALHYACLWASALLIAGLSGGAS
ncbi:DUF3307 domain-containing protein [Jidongwangia harbinensis]|uniref:DUF3307 domain-containing protein n=1 Tax=Jidongwangia harbinensis TaxID=2878561 RepID=UPI001CD92DAA|nr:DUF3307 domain-containing protein [Jidongwangia harbinensis]MCA2219516.1 DUF3307 domain-containing protein [Jidongwangia harbinensis]